MRSFEFRVWHKPTQTMHDVLFFFADADEVFVRPAEGYSEVDLKRALTTPLLLSDCELMQFTGVLDSEGTKIFEGDILYQAPDVSLPVIFKCGSYGTPDKPIYCFSELYSVQRAERIDDMQVRGNIYQHEPFLDQLTIAHALLQN